LKNEYEIATRSSATVMRCELEQSRIPPRATAFFKYPYYVKAFTMLSEVGKKWYGRPSTVCYDTA